MLVLAGVAEAAAIRSIVLSHDQEIQIGKRVWKNECAGTVSGLTSWNAGEDFASLGIGHFIWYARGKPGPFKESFPPMVRYLTSRGAHVPAWLGSPAVIPCPWNTKAEFEADRDGPRMRELRQMLNDTVDLQAAVLVGRLQDALPQMLAQAAPDRRPGVTEQFYRVAGAPSGPYAMVDYVNFKGEGVLATERYKGEGWGLLQVLEGMHGSGPQGAVREFAASAKARLTRRVENSPPQRNERRWLSGWLKRVEGYGR